MASSVPVASINLAARINEILDTSIVGFINQSFNNIWAEVQPVFAILMAIYILFFGFGVMRGVVEMPLQVFLESIVKLSVIYGLVSSWSLFSFYIADVAVAAPDAIAGAVSGLSDSGSTASEQVGSIYSLAVKASGNAMAQRGVFQPYILGLIILIPSTLMMVYALFLIMLSKIAIAVLLGVAPLFLLCLMFKATRQMFEAWLKQVLNYVLIVVLAVSVLGLTNDISNRVVSIIPEEGIVMGAMIPACVVFLLVFLLLTQVQHIASSLAGGISLSTQNLGSYVGRKMDRAATSAGRGAGRAVGQGINKSYQAVQNRRSSNKVAKV